MKTKMLAFRTMAPGYAVAQSPIGKWVVFSDDLRWRARCHYCKTDDSGFDVGDTFCCESAARAACQAEFERIWREMTDFGASDE